MGIRKLLVAVVLAFGVGVATPSEASVSYAVVFDALVQESSAACVFTATDAKSVWENGRIYTYTHVRVDKTFVGSLAVGADIWVQTMGGAVGDIGQQVDGEAVLRVGATSLLFVTAVPSSSNYVVTARGQGQFPVVHDAAGVHLMHNAQAGALLAPNPATVARIRARTTEAVAGTPAAIVLDGKSLDDAAAAVARAWQRTHGH